ncbi:MAG TPA: Gfo/Idh/MocA family oxidoreductase [Spirochaetia bacterium]|nr:Gfo/Idh/MocA family oxidoreductase [Spirochaetia bacterium]
MSSQEIGVAVVGLGRAGMIHAANFRRGVEGARLEAVVDPSAEARKKGAESLGISKSYERLEQALEDRSIGALVVVTPTNLHRDIVVAASTAGKHVLCEKPMAMNAAECAQMIDAAERGGIKLQIGFMRRFDESFRQAKAAIDDGAIGEVVQIKGVTHGPSVPQRWMYDIRASNGPLAEVSSHDIDTQRWLAGSEVSELYTVAGNFRCPQAKSEFPDFYDTFLMTMRFADGKQGLIDGAASVFYGYDVRTEILGTKGILFVGDLGGKPVLVCTADGKLSQQANPSWRTLFAQAYAEEDRSFIRSIATDTAPLVSGRDGLEAVRVVTAGNLSIRERRPVRLEEV